MTNAAAMGVSSEVADDKAAASLFRKIGWRLVPVLALAYLVNYLDRTNIGFAALTMNQAIGLSSSQFGIGAGLFFIGYCVFEIPSNIAMYYVGARLWVARIMITWGLAATAMAFVVGPKSFYALRVLLGIAEAGFFPGVTFFLSSWFPARYRARILAWFLLAIPASSLLGGPVSGALLQLDGHGGLAGWQWMFVVEGLPAVLIGLWVLRQLSDRPSEAMWLTEDERRLATALIEGEGRERPRKDLLAAMRDPRVHLLALVQLGFTIGSYGVGVWLPQILKGFVESTLAIGFLSAVPYAFACVAMVLWAGRVDRRGGIVSNLALACLAGAAGLCLSVISASAGASLAGLTLALVGVTAARAIFWTIPGRFLVGVAAAGGFAYINTVAAVGGFLGPAMIGWIRDLTGSFTAGLLAMAAVLLLTTLLVLPLNVLGRGASE